MRSNLFRIAYGMDCGKIPISLLTYRHILLVATFFVILRVCRRACVSATESNTAVDREPCTAVGITLNCMPYQRNDPLTQRDYGLISRDKPWQGCTVSYSVHLVSLANWCGSVKQCFCLYHTRHAVFPESFIHLLTRCYMAHISHAIVRCGKWITFRD